MMSNTLLQKGAHYVVSDAYFDCALHSLRAIVKSEALVEAKYGRIKHCARVNQGVRSGWTPWKHGLTELGFWRARYERAHHGFFIGHDRMA